MIELDRSKFGFKIKETWFADAPYDINGYDAVYFNACKEKLDLEGVARADNTTLTIDLNQDINTIWRNTSKSSCRYAINKGKKDGVKIGKTFHDFDWFFDMDKCFRRERKIKDFYKPIKMLRNNTVVFFAVSNPKHLLSAQLYIYDGNIMRLTISTSNRLNVSKEQATLIGNASKLSIWEAIKWAKDNNIKTFDFGGHSKLPEHKSVNAFKESFGGVVTPYYNYTKIYSKLLNLSKVII